METLTTQFSLGTCIQISAVVPFPSVPLPVTPAAGADHPESPTFCTQKLCPDVWSIRLNRTVR